MSALPWYDSRSTRRIGPQPSQYWNVTLRVDIAKQWPLATVYLKPDESDDWELDE